MEGGGAGGGGGGGGSVLSRGGNKKILLQKERKAFSPFVQICRDKFKGNFIVIFVVVAV